MLPSSRKPYPPNIFLAVRPGSPDRTSRIRSASPSSKAISGGLEVAEHGADHDLHAVCHRFFVDVEARMVVAPAQTAFLIGAADKIEATRLLLEEVAKVLSAHHRWRLDHVLRPDDLGGDVHHQSGHLRLIDGRRVALRVVVLDLGAHCGSNSP